MRPHSTLGWRYPLATAFIFACSSGEPAASNMMPSAQAGSDAHVSGGSGSGGVMGGAMPPQTPNGGAGAQAAAGTAPGKPPSMDADAGADAGAPFVLPPGTVSSPGKYSGFGERVYSGYELTSEYVAVRDGTKLAVDLYRPKDADGKVVTTALPVLWMHTPYNRRTFTSPTGGSGLSGETYPGAAARLIEYGYVVAIADFRGLYASYGKNMGYNRGEWVDAARFDAYDITEWLAMQPWSDGNIGMWGCSATGGSQMQAATTAPPHLKAIFPMSCEFDAYPFGVPGGMAAAAGDTKTPPGGSSAALRDAIATPVSVDAQGTQLIAAIAEHANNVENPGYVPFRDSVAANIPEQWWIKSSPHTYLDAINQSGIALYVAANWDEAATKYGAFFTFNNVTTPAKLIVGPGSHCAWFTVEKNTSFDIAIEERRFFDHYLKGIENGVNHEPAVYYYTYNEAAGNEWRSASAWPLPEERRTPYYLAQGSLLETAPSEASAKDDRAVEYDVTATNLVQKGLSYESAALDHDLRVTGHPAVELWVSSTAMDGDFVATLQDVAADGTATTYNMSGRLRASLRKEQDPPYDNLGLPYHPFGSGDVQPLAANEATLLRFDLLPISIVFKAGHRIRLVLTFAEATTPVLSPAPTVSIYRDAAHASFLTLPIIDP